MVTYGIVGVGRRAWNLFKEAPNRERNVDWLQLKAHCDPNEEEVRNWANDSQLGLFTKH